MTPAKNKGGRPPRGFEVERAVVYLPVDLKRKLEHRAVDERKSLSTLVAEALKAFLKR